MHFNPKTSENKCWLIKLKCWTTFNLAKTFDQIQARMISKTQKKVS